MYVKNKPIKFKSALFILLFLFLGPLLGAWYLYSTGGSWSKKTVNHGTLIQPPLPFEQFTMTDAVSGQTITTKQFHGKWLVVYVAELPCETECQQVLYKMRQVRLTLGKDQRRVQLALIDKNKSLSQGYLYLVDPLDNVFMQYPQNVTPRALKDDLVRLLKVSRIG